MVADAVRRLIDEERLGAMATVVSGPDVGTKAVIDVDLGYVAGELPGDIADDVLADARELADHEQSRTLAYGNREVFIETVAPPPQLIVFGADQVAEALVTIAVELGYRVIVTDPRPAFTTADRFPEAEQVVVGWPDETLPKLEVDRRTYIVLLSHNARFEDPVLRAILPSRARYIGAMGSRRTHAKRVDKLAGWGFAPEDIDRIHGPVGLDIGAELPAEVAVSILAEMIQVRYGHGSGESLRGRSGRIHAQRVGEADV